MSLETSVSPIGAGLSASVNSCEEVQVSTEVGVGEDGSNEGSLWGGG